MAPPNSAIPPPLPPSVEESYRRKCIQLRHRMNEVEEANDASHVRLLRMRRGIEKMRLERAFLLEQLAKRTSTNVEDSEGSPSPPPTPKEKPLRTKRGHRKPSFLTNLDATRTSSAFMQAPTLSPSNSDAFSQNVAGTSAPKVEPATNGSTAASHAPLPTTTPAVAPSRAPRRPRNGFEFFASEVRSVLLVANRKALKDGTYDIDEDIARKWQGLGHTGQDTYYKAFARGSNGGYQEALEEVLTDILPDASAREEARRLKEAEEKLRDEDGDVDMEDESDGETIEVQRKQGPVR